MKTYNNNKHESLTIRQALDRAVATGKVAVLVGKGPAVITQDEADRLRAEGTSFAYLCIHEGKVVTVPVN